MRVYSVGEAIGPAWERTKMVLRSGRWGTNFKIALVALLAEAGALMILPVQAFMNPFNAGGSALPAPAAHAFAAAMFVVGLVMTAIYAAVFYFGSRMQLTLVDLILTRSYTVAPLWNRHRQSVWRWMALKLVPSILFLIGLVPFVAAMGRIQAIIRPAPMLDARIAAQAQMHAMHHIFVAMFTLWAGYFLMFGLAMLLYSHWRDFVMPYLGIDQLSVAAALRRWLLLWQTYPAQMTGYVFFRLLLLLGVVIVLYTTLLVAGGAPALLAVLFGILLKVVIHGLVGTVLTAMFALCASVAVVVWYLCVLLFAGAFYCIFFQCYALYFLGGRDPRIGALLEPDVLSPWTPPPSLPREDEGDGPDLPGDPALA